MTHKSVLLDTSFFLRFLNEDDPLFKNAEGYYRYFLENGHPLIISTISVAEYCVRGKIDELPLKTLQILPFNFNHAVKAGTLAKIVFDNKGKLQLQNRNIIPNDTKLFAQAEVETEIDFYLSSDAESKKIFDLPARESGIRFKFLNLATPHSEAFGVLDF